MLESESAYVKLPLLPPPPPKKTSSSYHLCITDSHTDYIVSFSWEGCGDWINLWAEENTSGHLSKNQLTSFIIRQV